MKLALLLLVLPILAIKIYAQQIVVLPSGDSIIIGDGGGASYTNYLNKAGRSIVLGLKSEALTYLDSVQKYNPDLNLFYEYPFLGLNGTPKFELLKNNYINHIKEKKPQINDMLCKGLWKLGALDQLIVNADSLELKRNYGFKTKKEFRVKIQFQLDSLVLKYGIPDTVNADNGALTSFFLIVQHADKVYLQQKLNLITEKYKKRLFPPDKYAHLVDVLLIHKNEKQLYGTQIRFNRESGEDEVYPISDEINVDKRRKEMNLEPLADYLFMVKTMKHRRDFPSRQRKSLSIYYSTNSNSFPDSEINKLKQFLSGIDSLYKISIIGYADDVGDGAKNKRLSLKRANTVYEQLIKFKVNPLIIDKPLGNGKIEIDEQSKLPAIEQRKLNRKVEVVFYYAHEKITPLFSSKSKVGDKLVLGNILFVSNSHEFLPASIIPLKRLTGELLKNKYTIRLEGHVHGIKGGLDGRDEKTNKFNLSEARAKAVYDYLIKNGIEAKRLSFVGLKGDFPIGIGELNQRVEVVITGIK